MLNFHQLIALDDQNFSATKNIPHDSTTFPLSAVLKRAYDIWLGSYIVLNECDCGWQKSHIYCYDSPLCPHHVPKNRTVYIPIHFAHWKKIPTTSTSLTSDLQPQSIMLQQPTKGTSEQRLTLFLRQQAMNRKQQETEMQICLYIYMWPDLGKPTLWGLLLNQVITPKIIHLTN